MTNGKGDSPRPLGVSREEYDVRWRLTFQRSCTWCKAPLSPDGVRLWGRELVCGQCLEDAMRVGPSTHTEEGE